MSQPTVIREKLSCESSNLPFEAAEELSVQGKEIYYFSTFQVMQVKRATAYYPLPITP